MKDGKPTSAYSLNFDEPGRKSLMVEVENEEDLEFALEGGSMFKNKAPPYPILDRSDNLRDDYVDGDYQVALKVQEPSEDGLVTFKFMHQCSVKALTDLVATEHALIVSSQFAPTLSQESAYKLQGLQTWSLR